MSTPQPTLREQWQQDRAEMEVVEQRFPSGTRQYRVEGDDEEAARRVSLLMEAEGGWVLVSPERATELFDRVRAELAAEDRRRDLERHPGWRVPQDQRNRWPIYPSEAVTFTTEWGPVTVGRSLARIYDLDGWPNTVTLETMARQQAAREGVPA